MSAPATAAPRLARGLGERAAYAPARHPAPVDLKLDANEGRPPRDLPPAAELLAALDSDRYPTSAPLERRLAERLGLGPPEVLVTAGADDALFRACVATLEPGRELLVATPTFEMLPRYAALAGGSVRAVPWPDGPFPAGAVASAAGPRTGLVAVVSPNNPTGGVATADDLRRLAAAAPGAVLLLDHAYVELADEDLTAAALEMPNALVCLLYTSPSPRDRTRSRMPSSA